MREKTHNPLVAFGDQGTAVAIQPSREQRDCYGDMLRSVADWHWETDRELNLTHVSAGLTVALGHPGQSLLGRPMFELVDQQTGNVRAVQDAVHQRRPFRVEGLRLRGRAHAGAAEGANHGDNCRLTGLPYYEVANGQFAGYRGTGTSTEASREGGAEASAQLLKILDAALARKDELEWQLAEASDRILQARLAAVAHELRTPLNAIIGFAEAIKDKHLGDDPDRQRGYARNIHESGHHLLEVIEGLFGSGEAAPDLGEPRPSEVNVAEIAAGALRMLEPKAEAAGITVINALPNHLPAARGEGHVLRQILLNLLTNAIKYTPRGGSIGIEARIEHPDLLRVMIWDTGVGIAPEDQERVFQHAYRAPQTEEDRPGSGLGLAISRNLAQGLGGDIEISSVPKKGTRVSLHLIPAKED